MPAQIKPKIVWTKMQLIFYLGWMCFIVTHILWHSVAASPNLLEGVDSFSGQMHGGGKECPFSGITNGGRVWRKGARKWGLECVCEYVHTYTCVFSFTFCEISDKKIIILLTMYSPEKRQKCFDNEEWIHVAELIALLSWRGSNSTVSSNHFDAFFFSYATEVRCCDSNFRLVKK